MKVLWRIAYRWNLLRAQRAEADAACFKSRAEKFCTMIKGEKQ